MDGHAIYVHGHAKNDDFPIDFAIFTKALRTDGRTDQRTNGPTDQRTDGRTNPHIEMRRTHLKMGTQQIGDLPKVKRWGLNG